MQHGFAPRAGLTAAALAASGYVGIKRVFERDYGDWLGVFGECHHPDAGQVYDGLGAVWETGRIAVKAFAAMGLLHAGIAAALQLRAAGGCTAGQIDGIDIDMPEAAYGHGGWQAVRPLAPIGAQMSIMYAVAVALLDGAVLIDQFAEDRINRDDVWNLIDRTRTRHQKAYDPLLRRQDFVVAGSSSTSPNAALSWTFDGSPWPAVARHRGALAPWPDKISNVRIAKTDAVLLVTNLGSGRSPG